jgi:hypothetical protein
MGFSLRRANRAAKAAWDDPKWQKPPEVFVAPEEEPDIIEEEVRRALDERLKPIVDQDGIVWRRTIPRTPPLR